MLLVSLSVKAWARQGFGGASSSGLLAHQAKAYDAFSASRLTSQAAKMTNSKTATSERVLMALEGDKVPSQASKELQTFPNPRPSRDFEILFTCPEFTCLCPMTGQPDFATIIIRYTPIERCVELKSLKLYLWSYRQEGAFHEDVTNRILDDLVGLLTPLRMTVVGDFMVRGGIHTVVTAKFPYV